MPVLLEKPTDEMMRVGRRAMTHCMVRPMSMLVCSGDAMMGYQVVWLRVVAPVSKMQHMGVFMCSDVRGGHLRSDV